MIKLVRVDHRLLHGQVIFSWTKQVGTNYIIVADDKREYVNGMKTGMERYI